MCVMHRFCDAYRRFPHIVHTCSSMHSGSAWRGRSRYHIYHCPTRAIVRMYWDVCIIMRVHTYMCAFGVVGQQSFARFGWKRERGDTIRVASLSYIRATFIFMNSPNALYAAVVQSSLPCQPPPHSLHPLFLLSFYRRGVVVFCLADSFFPPLSGKRSSSRSAWRPSSCW